MIDETAVLRCHCHIEADYFWNRNFVILFLGIGQNFVVKLVPAELGSSLF